MAKRQLCPRWAEEKDAVCTRLASNDPAIEELDLQSQGLTDADVEQLVSALRTNSVLTTLILNKNKIGPGGAGTLGKFLELNTSITTLYLSHNNLGPLGASSLSQMLERNKSLERLWLNSSDLKDYGVVCLASALQTNRTLSTLHIGNNGFERRGFASLATMLKTNTTLSHLAYAVGDGVLIVSQNYFASESAEDLLDMFKHNTTLASLSVSVDLVEETDKSALRAAIARNKAGCALFPALAVTAYTLDILAFEDMLSESALLAVSVEELVSAGVVEEDARAIKLQYATSAETRVRELLHAVQAGSDVLSKPYMRCKLLLMGRGRAGKTSTVNALLGRPFNKDEPSTVGCAHALVNRHASLAETDTVLWSPVKPKLELDHQLFFQDDCADDTREGIAPNSLDAIRAFSQRQSRRVDVATSSLPSATIAVSGAAARHDDPQQLSETQVAPSALSLLGALASPAIEQIRILAEDALLDHTGDDEQAAAEAQPDSNYVRFTIVDLAGQREFYDLLDLLLTRFAIYVLCFDMEDMVHGEKEKHDCLADIKTWLTSVHLHAPGASIVLVGTHKDVVKDSAVHQKLSDLLYECLASHPSFPHIKPCSQPGATAGLWFFPIDNTRADDAAVQGVAQLRDMLDKTALAEAFVKFRIPVKWLACLDSIRRAAEGSGRQCVSLGEVETVASQLSIPPEQCDLMLEIFHEFGRWLHFPAPRLRDVVVLDPQWIVDSFARVIRNYSLHSTPVEMSVLQQAAVAFDKLTKRARLHNSLLPLLWPSHSIAERDMMLQLMIDFHLAVPLRPRSQRSQAASRDGSLPCSEEYLIPSLLQNCAQDIDFVPTGWCEWRYFFATRSAMPNLEEPASCEQLASLGLLPKGLFNRLICDVLEHHQLTSFGQHSRALFADLVEVNLASTFVQLRLDPHTSSIRVRAHTNEANPVLHRLDLIISNALKSCWPSIDVLSLVQVKPNLLLKVDSLREAAKGRRSLCVEGENASGIGGASVQQICAAFSITHGIREEYDVMISYRQAPNFQFVSKLRDVLGLLHLNRPSDPHVHVFYDQESLERGRQSEVDFGLGILRSTVVVPIMSCEAMRRMVLPDDGQVDYLLLEWMLMLVIHKTRSGRLRKILPIFLGDACRECSSGSPMGGEDVPLPPMASTKWAAWESWIGTHVKNVASTATYHRVREILPQLGVPTEAANLLNPSKRRVVQELLTYNGLARLQYLTENAESRQTLASKELAAELLAVGDSIEEANESLAGECQPCAGAATAEAVVEEFPKNSFEPQGDAGGPAVVISNVVAPESEADAGIGAAPVKVAAAETVSGPGVVVASGQGAAASSASSSSLVPLCDASSSTLGAGGAQQLSVDAHASDAPSSAARANSAEPEQEVREPRVPVHLPWDLFEKLGEEIRDEVQIHLDKAATAVPLPPPLEPTPLELVTRLLPGPFFLAKTRAVLADNGYLSANMLCEASAEELRELGLPLPQVREIKKRYPSVVDTSTAGGAAAAAAGASQ